MTSTSRSESINSFFDGFVHARTPLDEFVVQYDKAVKSRRAAELQADFATIDKIPVLISEFGIEVHASRRYTRANFSLFQQEYQKMLSLLSKKISNEIPKKYLVGNECASKWMCVQYDESGNLPFKCECRKFESDGILCSHILLIMKKKDYGEIPECYILPRWTIDARKALVQCLGTDVTNAQRLNKPTIAMSWAFRDELLKYWEMTNEDLDLHNEFKSNVSSWGRDMANRKRKENPMPENEVSSPIVSRDNASALSITIRDPAAPVKTKGRPKQPSRYQSGLETGTQSHLQGERKKKTCGYCGELGHYRTGCAKAKADKQKHAMQDGDSGGAIGEELRISGDGEF